MTDACETLHAYVDGELDDASHSAFETHLASCDDCTAELPRLLALMTALDAAAASFPAGAKRLVVIDGGSDAPGDRSSRSPSRRPRRPLWIAGGATAVLAAAAAVLVLLPHTPPAQPVASLASELGPTRAIEARLSYPGTERYRKLDVARGGRTGEPISTDSRIQLERAGDWHGLAVASLLAGERERAAQLFAKVTSPRADSDRAALELLDGSQPAFERALDDVDRALAAAPGDPAALWNRALVLAALGLPTASAREFDRIAALGEPGWADEARTRAETLRSSVTQRRLLWRQAYEAGRKMIEAGTPVPAALAAVTGTTTIMFYDAVRSAPSKDRALALLPLAEALDAAYRTDRLSRYVQRVAAADFRVRKPLADSYRELALQRLAPGAVEPFLARLARTPGVDDIRMGALVHAGAVAAHLEDYRRLAAATQDPWFGAIAAGEAARAKVARGGLAAAERDLREAIAVAQRERVFYRGLTLAEQLTAIHIQARQLALVAREAQAQFRDAITVGEWIYETNALRGLASVNQNRYANGLARAYLSELLERSEPSAAGAPVEFDEQYDCPTRQYAFQSLASIALQELDAGRALSLVASVRSCPVEPLLQGQLDLQAAMVRSELFHLEHRDEDAQAARHSIAAARAVPGLTPGHLSLLQHIEGALALDVDRAAGRRALRDAIAAAGRQSDEFSVKARDYSYSLLALDAGAASEFADVLGLIAETLDVPRPERCAVAIAVQGQRSVVAYADARGAIAGEFAANRKTPEVDARTLVSPAIVERLRGCERVSVLARAPVLGAGRVLPPSVAWTYVLRRSSTAPPPAASGKRLVVANPLPPPDLNLPPLGPPPDEPAAPGLTILRGAEATPTRVLLDMRDAAVIEFHTHGVIANDVSEASYLVLSPEQDRQYAMTPDDVERAKLSAAPLVILGACHAATSARSLEGGIGLAEAFLRAGSRAVVASPDAIQDLGAHAFFAAVREGVEHGADPAVAVRDERVRRLAASPDNAWVAGVVVFE